MLLRSKTTAGNARNLHSTVHIIQFLYLITEYGRMAADTPGPSTVRLTTLHKCYSAQQLAMRPISVRRSHPRKRRFMSPVGDHLRDHRNFKGLILVPWSVVRLQATGYGQRRWACYASSRGDPHNPCASRLLPMGRTLWSQVGSPSDQYIY